MKIDLWSKNDNKEIELAVEYQSEQLNKLLRLIAEDKSKFELSLQEYCKYIWLKLVEEWNV